MSIYEEDLIHTLTFAESLPRASKIKISTKVGFEGFNLFTPIDMK